MTRENTIKTLEHMREKLLVTDTPYHDAVSFAIQALKQTKGEWIVGEYMDCHSDILPKYTCPFCGEVAYRKYDFCHCGADLRESEGE